MTARKQARPMALTREGRDTLWLLAMLALTIAPHVGRLPWWCLAGTATALGWRAWLAVKDGPLPPRWVLLLALVLSVASTMITFQSLLGRAAGVTLVTLLAGLKTLELRARRDAFVVTSLGFFLILTQFLHDQGPLTAVLMAVALIGLLASLVLAQRPLGRPPIQTAVREACRALGWGLPLALVLYLFFPRLGPLWSLPSDAMARTGLSDRMELGHVAELAQDDTIAMRVRFDGPVPPPRSLYFRGPVLDLFDGRQWRSLPDEAPQRWHPTMAPAGEPSAWRYTLALEPQTLRNLPLLDGTTEARVTAPDPGIPLRRTGPEWSLTRPRKERLTFAAEAQARWQPLVQEGDPLLQTWVALPEGHAARTIAWARLFQSQQKLASDDTGAVVQALLRHIRTAGFRYTLAPGVDAPDANGRLPDPIDAFWLDRQAGFCEHFSAAFVVVMLALDIPARVVTGFQGAERNPVDGWHEVRNRDAHAWAEVWWPHRGWVRVDPTAAVAPDRVERPRRLVEPAAGQAPGTLARMAPDWVRQARAGLDAARHRWNTWVQGYNRQSQLELLERAGFETPDTEDLLRVVGTALALGSLVGVGWLMWQRPRHRTSQRQRALRNTARCLTRAGLPLPPGSPPHPSPLTWARALEERLGGATSMTLEERRATVALAEHLAVLDALHYGAEACPPAEWRHAMRTLREHARAWQRARRPSRAPDRSAPDPRGDAAH